ncbi:DUF551 domain-containing protein [Klebsiella pneumoniae]|nr:DUF551 domain-containing protein [Klebsiella pneumoniae]
MTKSTITRERLEQLADNNTICKVSWDERIELAQIALAAMDSEPVAEVVSIYGDPEAFGEREIRPLVGIQQMPYGTKLYRHAQPAPVVPVVPEEATPDSIEILASARRRDHAVFQWDEDQRNAAADSWNACRAAMLAAAPQSPGSEPATVPGKWIPVSEQMPDDEQEVLTINKIGHRFVSFFDKHSGLFFDRLDAPAACCIEHVLVTHWMPLPAAPQEVKGE